MVLEILSPSLVICCEENKTISYFAFACFPWDMQSFLTSNAAGSCKNNWWEILLEKIWSTQSLKFIKIKILAKVFTGILLQNKNENPDFSTDLFFF